ncbi:MAG TPA: hypothetical protein VF681_04995 [Abditibacteriaceae bacterium]|jgi:hypothetical protein
MKNASLTLAVLSLTVFASAPKATACNGQCKMHAHSAPKHASLATKNSITRAVNVFFSNPKNSVAGRVRITDFDIQGRWALVHATPIDQKLDPASVLLKKSGTTWKALVAGSSLRGTGKQYRAPQWLRKRWGL